MSAPLREGVTQSPADEVLARFFAAGQQYSAVPGHGQLWSALADATSGGKAFRPELFHSVYLGLGGTDQVIAANVAAALELLHTALVVHDDVIDGDTIRRGRPNVAGTFAATARARGHREVRARHYGDTAAILAGDLALVGAVRTLAGSGADPATTTRMLDLLAEAVHVSAAGELTDVRLSMEGCADVADAITMAYHKTAVYSFGLPLRLAAVLSGQERYEEVLTEYAHLLGVAYQLRDDLEGMFGDEATIGKCVLSDLREGKCTPLIAHARTTDAWPRIHPHLGRGAVEPATATQVRVLLEECGSRAYITSLARDLADQARHVVVDLPIGELLARWADVVMSGGGE